VLSSLHIRNYILIDSLDISFPEGLIIITGQTGAGKSILMGALSLLAGAKADASVISGDADSCVVEAEFDGPLADVASILEEHDIDSERDHLIIRRTVSASGRSRCFVNDCPAQLGVLQEISSRLFDIHSQHRSLLLYDRSFQLKVLDFFAGNSSALVSCRESFRELSSRRKELAILEQKMSQAASRAEYDSAQLRELRAADLRDGELEELEQEQKVLSNAEQVKETLSMCSEIFDPSSDERTGVTFSLKEARRLLEKLGSCLPAASALCERLHSAAIEVEDIASEVEELNRATDLSSEHLEAVESRLSLLYSLLKKHSCNSVAQLIELKEEYDNSFSGQEDMEDKAMALRKEIDSLSKEYDFICQSLHESRQKAIPSFCSDILTSLSFLELSDSRFEISLSECAPSENGKDSVSFLFSANNNAPKDVALCASGGEMSRIMLSLKGMMARFVSMPTLVFDEIDTGVSGSVADKMGRMICKMGETMQVVAITHLPQVAAKGKAHYVVVKNNVDGRILSSIERVSGKERENEIARLLSGSDITLAALANARELLKG